MDSLEWIYVNAVTAGIVLISLSFALKFIFINYKIPKIIRLIPFYFICSFWFFVTVAIFDNFLLFLFAADLYAIPSPPSDVKIIDFFYSPIFAPFLLLVHLYCIFSEKHYYDPWIMFYLLIILLNFLIMFCFEKDPKKKME